MVAGGLQTFLPRGVELTARLTALNNAGTQHVKIEIKGRDNRIKQRQQKHRRSDGDDLRAAFNVIRELKKG